VHFGCAKRVLRAYLGRSKLDGTVSDVLAPGRRADSRLHILNLRRLVISRVEGIQQLLFNCDSESRRGKNQNGYHGELHDDDVRIVV
jgi:hypothetical protein